MKRLELKKKSGVGKKKEEPWEQQEISSQRHWPFLNNFSTKMFGNQQRQLLELSASAGRADLITSIQFLHEWLQRSSISTYFSIGFYQRIIFSFETLTHSFIHSFNKIYGDPAMCQSPFQVLHTQRTINGTKILCPHGSCNPVERQTINIVNHSITAQQKVMRAMETKRRKGGTSKGSWACKGINSNRPALTVLAEFSLNCMVK